MQGSLHGLTSPYVTPNKDWIGYARNPAKILVNKE